MGYKQRIGETDSSGSAGGKLLFNPGTLGMKNVTHPTIFRIFPSVNSKGQIEPHRYSSDKCDFSDWMLPIDVIRYWGTPDGSRLVCVLQPSDLDRTAEPPLTKFYWAVHNAIKSGSQPTWAGLKNWDGKTTALSSIQTCAMVQGVLYFRKNAEESAKYQGGVMRVALLMPKSAREALEDTVDALDYDPFSPTEGRLVKFFMPTSDQTANLDALTERRSGRKKDTDDFKRYEIEIMDKKVPASPEIIVNNFVPWDKAIKRLTTEEQIHLLRAAFPSGPGKEAVEFVFGKATNKTVTTSTARETPVEQQQLETETKAAAEQMLEQKPLTTSSKLKNGVPPAPPQAKRPQNNELFNVSSLMEGTGGKTVFDIEDDEEEEDSNSSVAAKTIEKLSRAKEMIDNLGQ